MQNKCNHGDVNYISLDGGWDSGSWICGGCGCSNCGCENCGRCGWNRCGCDQGSGVVVSTGARRNRDNRNACCDQKKADQQRNEDGCECRNQSRSKDCGCSNATYGSRSLYAECCDGNTRIRDLSCDGKGMSGKGQGRNGSCDQCDKSDRCSECSSRNDARTGRNEGCCKCSKDQGNAYGGSRKNKGVGMVWAAEQELDQVFESESALRSGTLFPELHKPMNGYCPGKCNCQTDEQAAAFAAWELRLYLNTHPNDKQALALFRKLCEETNDPNYATSFLEDKDCDSGWDWTDDPWPWECRPCGK